MESPVYQYSESSRRQLETCHHHLQILAKHLIRERDIAIVCGHRSAKAQQAAFDAGKSKAVPGRSPHNQSPSLAFDIVPVEALAAWKNHSDLPVSEWKEFAKWVIGVAERLKIKVRWGGDWDMDGDSTDQKLFDAPHFELLEWDVVKERLK